MARIETDSREGHHTLWLAATGTDDHLVGSEVLQAAAAHIRATSIDAEVRVTTHDGIACLAISGDMIGRNHALARGGEGFYQRGCTWVMTVSDFAWLKTYLRNHA